MKLVPIHRDWHRRRRALQRDVRELAAEVACDESIYTVASRVAARAASFPNARQPERRTTSSRRVRGGAPRSRRQTKIEN
jgi:hypothetical protein